MASAIKCDRCKKFELREKAETVEALGAGGTYRFDLCFDCTEAHERFMRGPGTR